MPTANADHLLALHHRSTPLVLPNAWDVASALIIQEAGFDAIATTSAGMAWSLGYPDGEVITRDEMLAAVARISRAVNLPVSADLEGAYGLRPEDAADTVRGAIRAGVAGINLEDGSGDRNHPLLDVAAQAERLRAARAAADALGVHLVINARTNVYLAGVGAPETRFAEAVRRLTAYRDAGADCLFAIGVADGKTIGALVRELNAPLNVIATPTSPSIAELAKLGVARISLGSGVMGVALGVITRRLASLRTDGRLDTFLEGEVSYPHMQQLTSKR